MKFSIVAAALLGSALLSYAAPIDLNERFVGLKVFADSLLIWVHHH